MLLENICIIDVKYGHHSRLSKYFIVLATELKAKVFVNDCHNQTSLIFKESSWHCPEIYYTKLSLWIIIKLIS